MKHYRRILAFLLAGAMIFSLAACSGGGSESDGNTDADVETTEESEEVDEPEEPEKTLYGGWLRADLPEGYEVYNDTESEFHAALPDSTSTAIIQITVDNRHTAQEEAEEKLGYTSGDYEASEDIVFGDITWKVVTFTWNGDLPSAYFFADIPGQEANIEVCSFCRGKDDELILGFLESIEFEDDAYEANQTFLREYWEKKNAEEE